MQIPYNIKIVLSENDKRILVIIFLVFLLLVLLIGILTKAIKKEEKKEGLKLDKYVNGYVKYGFIKTEKEFKKVNSASKGNYGVYTVTEKSSYSNVSIYCPSKKEKFFICENIFL